MARAAWRFSQHRLWRDPPGAGDRAFSLCSTVS